MGSRLRLIAGFLPLLLNATKMYTFLPIQPANKVLTKEILLLEFFSKCLFLSYHCQVDVIKNGSHPSKPGQPAC